MIAKSQAEIEIVREHLLELQVCTTITDPEELTRKVNAMHSCGTTNGWLLAEAEDLRRSGTTNPTRCTDHDDRQHWLFLA